MTNKNNIVMKANVTEKIYLSPITLEEVKNVITRPTDSRDIEYTRTDAFIEKACDAYCEICDTKECDGCAECAWVIKFRRQLEKL